MRPSFKRYELSQRGLYYMELYYMEGVDSFRMMYNIEYRDVLSDSFRRCLDYDNYMGVPDGFY